MNGSWDGYLESPADVAGADDIITNLAKEREPGIEIIERTPQSLIIISVKIYIYFFRPEDFMIRELAAAEEEKAKVVRNLPPTPHFALVHVMRSQI